MSTLSVSVPFYENAIPCLLDAEDPAPSIVLRPVCDALGLDYDAQHKRLLQQPWAVVDAKTVAAEQDAAVRVAVVDRLTFAMWLATLNAARLKRPGAKAKVELYQREAARAVEQHFYGTGGEPARNSGTPLTLLTVELIGELIERQVACERRLAALEAASRAC